MLKSIKFYFATIFTFTYCVTTAQISPLESYKKKVTEWEEIILQAEQIKKDTLSLKDFANKLIRSKSEDHQILGNLIMANFYSVVLDRRNQKSDFYFTKSLRSSKKLDHNALEIWTTLNYAEYFYHFRQITTALPFYITAIEQLESIDPALIILPAESFTKVGFYIGTIGENGEAISYLKKALTFTKPNTSQFAKISDNLGMYFLRMGDLNNARKNIIIASEAAKKSGDLARYAKTLGNLAQIYERNRDFSTAINLVLEDIRISEEENSLQNTMFAYTLLTRLYIANKEYVKAEETAEKATKIAQSKPYFKINELETLKLKLQIIGNSGKEKDELAILRRIGILQDSLTRTDGILPLNQSNWMMQKRKFQQNIASTNEDLSREFYFKNFILLVVGLFLLIFFVLFIKTKGEERRKYLESEKRMKEYEAAKLKNELQLQEAHRTLDSQVDFLKDKNILIKNLHFEIEKIQNSKSKFDNHERDRGKLNSLLQSHLMTEENWRNFRSEFQNEYPDFYATLHESFPEITDSNLRIILLQKLGFTNLEISGLLGITVDAVKKSKQRLKRKLGEKYEQLSTMIYVQNQKTL